VLVFPDVDLDCSETIRRPKFRNNGQVFAPQRFMYNDA
jgi:acyl-CoA reductase-like NAD-dependent aldehyde dehydrogenase